MSKAKVTMQRERNLWDWSTRQMENTNFVISSAACRSLGVFVLSGETFSGASKGPKGNGQVWISNQNVSGCALNGDIR